MGLFSGIKNSFANDAPKVACPKCGTVHEINAGCRCPRCGLKYKLPKEYDVYVERARAAASAGAAEQRSMTAPVRSGEEYSNLALQEASRKRKKKKSGTLIKLSAFAVVFSLLFLAFVFIFFRDKDALVFKTGEYENQPVFYHTDDGELHCVFPNNKSCSVGNGELISYLSSADGKCVYLTFTGEFASAKESNYVLRISKFGKTVDKIAESREYMPSIISGGNNKYLYILMPKDETGTLFDLTVSVDGDEPEQVAKDVREVAVSTSGRYALINFDESGSSKLMVYSAANRELSNPGIKNAHPLSIDNKGEYMIYARKNTADSTDIIVEKSTTERIEIPIFKESALKSVIFSEDRRTFAAEYTDKTVFYTCTDKDYSISNTYEGSLFGYDFNDNVCHNYLSFKEIPKISNVYGRELLPYYFYDRTNKFVYVISDGGTKESVFDTYSIDSLRVSDNDRCAFVSNDVLYTGRLDKKNNEITKILSFGDKTLIDISSDGKYVFYSDADGNMFRAEYGKEAKEPLKLAVDTDIIKTADDGSRMVAISGDYAEVIDGKGKSTKLCDGLDIANSTAASKDLSRFFYVTVVTDEETGEIKKSLYFYDSGKTSLISGKVADVCFVKDSARFDITKSSYVDMLPADVWEDASQESTGSGIIPAPNSGAVNSEAESVIPVPVPVPAA